MRDLSPKEFEDLWPGGYYGPGDYQRHVRGVTADEVKAACVTPFRNDRRDKRVLEIGPGGGFWTERLVGWPKTLVIVDVVPPPAGVRRLWEAGYELQYVDVGDQRSPYTLPSLDLASFDFVLSIDVFCHLSQEACATYLRSIREVLRPGGDGVIMYADFTRHPRNVKAEDVPVFSELVAAAGFEVVTADLLPAARDVFCHFRRPA